MNWPTKKLGEICESYFSGTWGEEPNDNTNLVKVIRVSDIKDNFSIDYKTAPLRKISSKYLEKYKLKTGDIIVVKSSGSKRKIISGRAAYFEEQNNQVFIPSNFLLTLRISKEKALSKFIWYFLLTKKVKDYVKSIVEGTTYPNLNISQYLNLTFSLPPLSEQQKIVYILDTIQEAVEVQDKIIEKTKELKKSLMAKLFREGTIKKSKIKNQKPKLQFNIQKKVKLGEIIEVIQYGISKKGKSDGIYPILRMNNLKDGKINIQDLQFVDLDKKEFEKFKLETGDVIFNRTNSIDLVGKTALFDLKENFVFASYLLRLKPKKSAILPEFLNYYLNWDKSQIELKRLASRGASQVNISATRLKTFEILLPSLSEQREIAEILQTIDQKIEIEQKKKALYEELFKTMLNKLMTGEIRVNNLKV